MHAATKDPTCQITKTRVSLINLKKKPTVPSKTVAGDLSRGWSQGHGTQEAHTDNPVTRQTGREKLFST